MPGQGTAQIDFGAFPGTPSTTVNVTGQGGITALSLVEAWIMPGSTVDHSVDEHIVDPPRVIASQASIIAGTGFTITGFASGVNTDSGLPLAYGKWNVAWCWSDFPSSAGLQAQRTLLTSAQTFYIRSDGNDTNTGLVNAAAPPTGAFLTLNGAYSAIAKNYDFGGNTVTLFNGNGATYTVGLTIGDVAARPAWTGGGTFAIDLNGGAINVTSSNCLRIALTCDLTGNVSLNNGSISVTTGGTAILVSGQALITLGDTAQLNYAGTAGFAFSVVNSGSKILFNNNMTISGGCSIFWNVGIGGSIVAEGLTFTLTGTPAFSTQFASASDGGKIICDGNTFTGAATGTRYKALSNGVIDTGSAGANYLPGNAAGTEDQGGIYV